MFSFLYFHPVCFSKGRDLSQVPSLFLPFLLSPLHCLRTPALPEIFFPAEVSFPLRPFFSPLLLLVLYFLPPLQDSTFFFSNVNPQGSFPWLEGGDPTPLVVFFLFCFVFVCFFSSSRTPNFQVISRPPPPISLQFFFFSPFSVRTLGVLPGSLSGSWAMVPLTPSPTCFFIHFSPLAKRTSSSDYRHSVFTFFPQFFLLSFPSRRIPPLPPPETLPVYFVAVFSPSFFLLFPPIFLRTTQFQRI